MPAGMPSQPDGGQHDGAMKLHRRAAFGEVSNAIDPKESHTIPGFLKVGTDFAVSIFPFGVAAETVVASQKQGGARNFASRESYGLETRHVDNLLAATAHAYAIARPFTRIVSIHWEAAGVKPAHVAQATGRFIDLLSKAMARKGCEITWLWVQENGEGKGAHVHIMVHVPASLAASVARLQIGWLRRITGNRYRAKVIKSDPIGRLLGLEVTNPVLHASNVAAVLAYVLKGATWDAAQTFGLDRLDGGGRCIGKRCAVSQNIGPKARGAFAKRSADPCVGAMELFSVAPTHSSSGTAHVKD